MVLVEQRCSRRAGLGRTGIPIGHADMGAVPGARSLQVGGRGRRIVLVADRLLVGPRMMHGDGHRDVLPRPVPARVGHAPFGIRALVQHDDREIGGRVGGQPGRTRLGLVQLTVARAAAGRSLVVPVDDERGCVRGVHPTVSGGHEVRGAVLVRVVDHEAGTEQATPTRVDGHRRDLVPPSVAIGTDHVDVARAGQWNRRLPEPAIADVDRRKLELQPVPRVRGDGQLHDELVGQQHGCPQLAVGPVVVRRVRTQDLAQIGGVEQQSPAVRHAEAREAEVERPRSRRAHPQAPNRGLRVRRLPQACGLRGDLDRIGNGVARR